MHAVTLWTKSKIELYQSLFSREQIIRWLSPLEKDNHLLVGHFGYDGTVESGVCVVLSARSPLQLRLDIHTGYFSSLILGALTFSFPRSWILRFLAHRIQNYQILAPSVLNAEFWLDPLLTLRFYNPRYFQFQGFFCSYNKFQSESMRFGTRIEYKECVQSDDDILSIQMHARARHW